MSTNRTTADQPGQTTGEAPPSVQPRGPARRPWRFPLAGCSLVCLGVVLGACGGVASSDNAVAHTATTTATTEGPTAPQGNAAGPGSASGVEQSLKFAGCMRSHGEPNFPDSAVKVNPNGGILFQLSKSSGIDSSSPTFKSALQACQSLVPHPPNHARACPPARPTSSSSMCSACALTACPTSLNRTAKVRSWSKSLVEPIATSTRARPSSRRHLRRAGPYNPPGSAVCEGSEKRRSAGCPRAHACPRRKFHREPKTKWPSRQQ